LIVCHLAAAANLRVAPHVSPELSVTVAAAAPTSVFIEYIPQMEPILRRPLRRDDGFAVPFDTPGHGIEFDEDSLERFTVKTGRSEDHRLPSDREREPVGATLRERQQ
jgi:mandelate racemase